MTQNVSTPDSGTDRDSDELLDSFLGITETTRKAEKEGVEESELDVDNEEMDASDTSDEEVEDQVSEEPEDESEEAPDEEAETGTDEYVDHSKKVKLSDGTETTVDELIRGNLRQANFTQKTQELANTRKELETRSASIAQNEIALDLALEITLASIPQEPTQELLQNNPLAYMQQKELYNNRMAEVAKLIEAKSGLAASKQEEQNRQFTEWVMQEQVKAAQSMPELQNPETLERFNSDIIKAVSKYGFSEEDVAEIYDHRFLLLARDVIKYHKLMANKPQAVEKAKGKPPLSPTRKATNGKSTAGDMDRLRKSGGRDAAALDRVLDKFF